MKTIVLLSIPLLLGGISLKSAPPVVFHSKGAVQVASEGRMYVNGGMEMQDGAAITQEGSTVLTGDFIHNASSNVFTTDYANANTINGVVEFRGTGFQKITTGKPAYNPQTSGSHAISEMDRKTMYLKFPNLIVNNGDSVVITPAMGVSVNRLILADGNLRLKSDSKGSNDQDASLWVNNISDAVDYSGGYVEVERNVIYNMGRVTGSPEFKYFGFSAPLSNMYLDYFTDHWVFDQRMNNGVGGYEIRRDKKFEPGVGYFVIISQDPNIRPQDHIDGNLLIRNEHFIFNRTYYPDFIERYGTTIDPSDNPVPQEKLNTGDIYIPGGLKTGDNYLGNPYTCALDIESLFKYWGDDILPSIWVWSGQASNWLTITKDMSTMDDAQKVIPSQQLFSVEGINSVASFHIPASARTHNAHRFLRNDAPLRNELLIEVRDAELDNYSRMVIGLRSWGKPSGDDASDAKWLRSEDANVPQVYAIVPAGGNASICYDTLTINSLPENTRSADFDFVPPQKGGIRKYIMKLSRQESLDTAIAVLVDKKEKKEINLFETDTYEFYAEQNDDSQRFSILFTPEGANNINKINAKDRDAYFHEPTLYITHNRESDIQKSVEVYSTSGLLVYRSEITQAGTNTYELNLIKGVYVVRSGEMVKKFKL